MSEKELREVLEVKASNLKGLGESLLRLFKFPVSRRRLGRNKL